MPGLAVYYSETRRHVFLIPFFPEKKLTVNFRKKLNGKIVRREGGMHCRAVVTLLERLSRSAAARDTLFSFMMKCEHTVENCA